MTHALTTRPNLEHLRGQAKLLLADLRKGEPGAADAFRAHLPKAKALTRAQARSAGFRLADAQSVVARRNGFSNWSALVRHVDQLRALEGEWAFEALEVDGAQVPRAMIAHSKLLIDGDRFRMESPEANYDGTFTIDAAARPMRIDIDFVDGPEAGQRSAGLFVVDGDRLTICLGLVGADRPVAFATAPGTGHALERLRRASPARPAGVTGGAGTHAGDSRAAPSAAAVPPLDPADFARESSPMLARLEGQWAPVRLVTGGQEMRADWLPYGSRTAAGNEVKVVFGGQVMLHAKVRVDDTVVPIAVDYLHLHGRDKGKVSAGIMQWIGDEPCFLMAAPGQPRPSDFSAPHAAGLTLSQWRRVAP